jgi:DNA-binding NarL/FixJ family response regulator
MLRMTGLQAACEITRKPDMRVRMLSMHDSEQYLFEAIRVGASGYVLKSSVDGISWRRAEPLSTASRSSIPAASVRSCAST